MKNTIKILFALCLLAVGLEGFAQNLSNRGREFYVAYGHHQFMEPGQNNSQEMVIYLSAEEPAVVTVSINGTPWYRTYNVPANTVISTNSTAIAGFPNTSPTYMPKAGTYDCRIYDIPPPAGNGGEGWYERGIRILSDVPIVAYAHTFGSASSGATMLMPVETWGYSYISINSRQEYASNCFSWAYVMAHHDNTVVEIIPSVPTRAGRPPGVPFNITLNEGEVYQVIGASINTSTGHEVSGTKFKSIANPAGDCYPIAVFSGSSRTRNPISCGAGGGDNDNQQLFPTQAWGKRYLVAPTSRSTAPNQFMTNSYKVLVKDPTTVVKRNGVTLTGLTNNYYFFESSTADLITADKPIMVAQFMTGGGCLGGGLGDPEMIYVSPIEQGIKRTGFFRNNAEAIQHNYVTVIVPNGGTGLSSLKIDGALFASLPASRKHLYAHPQLPGYSVAIFQWFGFASHPSPPPGQTIVESDSAFTAITYGLGSVESYGYNAGTLINNLNAISSIQNQPDPNTPEHPYTCVNTPVKLSALIAYQPTSINWLISQLGTAITPNLDVMQTSPVSTGTVTVNGILYYKYSLPGNYVFNTADTFFLPIEATHSSIENCYNREQLTIKIIVKDRPVSDFSFTHTGCEKDSVYFTGTNTTSNSYTLSAWNWVFPASQTATGQNVTQAFPPGTHAITLNAVTTDGCSDDTSKTITVNPKPVAGVTASALSVCEDGTITFTPTATYFNTNALTAWFWNFGNGSGDTSTVFNSAPQTATYEDYGSYTIQHVVKASDLCVSDTASVIITVFANPEVSFNYPAGCLPPNGVVQFTSTSSTPDGQPISSYTWDFGDPNATPSNPNTSTLQNPTHTYTSFGNYTIVHGATTANGCTASTTVQASFNLAPVLQYTPITSVCENLAGTVSVANGSVTNGVPGTGTYHGPGTDGSGNFSPTTAGAGTHTIWYVYTTSAGCIDSVSQTVLVHAKPIPSFSNNATGCLSSTGTVQFSNSTTIADGQSLTWLWNFDDPNASGSNPNTSTSQNPSHNFGEGTYDVNLQVTSSNGCFAEITVPSTFAVTPALSFPVLNPVCENVAAFSVANASVTNFVNGTGTYSGPGTNAAGMFDPAAAGDGSHQINYSFTSNGGCTANITSSITVYPRPVSTFTLDNSICLDESVTLTSNNTIPSGSITTWSWNFGDGNTLTVNNGNPVTVSYATANSFNIQLTTTSDRGCVSVTYSQSIAVNPLPMAQFQLPSNVCMPGGVSGFTNQSTIPGNGSLSYAWDFGDGSGTSTAQSPSYTYASIGNYNVTLTVTSAAGCTDQASQMFNDFSAKPVALFSVSPQELCQGADNSFTDNSDPGTSNIQSWQWNFDDGTSSTVQNPVKRFNNPGTYDVVLVVRNAEGCISTPYTSTVTVHLQPVIDAGPSFTLPQGTVVQLKATANSPGLTFMWSPATDLDNPSILNPMLTANADMKYFLTAVGDFDCSAVDSIVVKILKPVNVPNIFTPNGDGIHDKWLIPNLEDYPGCTVQVFNRYGHPIFISQGYGTPWDGTIKGNPVPVGTYYYVIQLKNGFKPITGSITILR